ncbi:hypothetical protein LEP1GSC013_1098 [Leptospira interrogans serovar Valbuzzi str. Duyster]|nr:hypothetical protein LEP1GSC013_1098 [Leptospira interrogans serovar Valbuzzi str. Duyster]ENO72872.1 hypothetical protein LEP1GSC012_1486 [Leptospira interrogans serovar Valbuzzi str. Valbuzzi]
MGSLSGFFETIPKYKFLILKIGSKMWEPHQQSIDFYEILKL